MLWPDKVEAWKADEVTKAFLLDIEKDVKRLMELLWKEDLTPYEACRLQGMIRALKGVLDIPDLDGIPEPDYKGAANE